MNGKSCAFLTMDDTEGWSIDAGLGIPPLEARGWCVTQVPWRSPHVDWRRFDAVYIGTPWDYPDDPGRFVGVLERIDGAGPVLVNDLALVRWNIAKTCLRDLESRGALIIPSRWHEGLEPGQLERFFDEVSSRCIVVKPVIGLNAADTYRLTHDSFRGLEGELLRTFQRRRFIVQPFVESIGTEGECSLFYFGGRFSHAIRKIPAPRDFRVQEEHGARILPLAPEPALVACADRILALVEPEPVYARCDLVRGPEGQLLLMELELIEPSLYLRMDAAAPERFAAAFDRYVARRRAG